MSIRSGLSPQLQEKNHKKLFHQRHDNYDSGELDVFEAARYFSGASDISVPNFMPQQIMRSGGRISLDMINPMSSSSSSRSTSRSSSNIATQNHHHQQQQQNVFHKATKESNIKKCKQPNSPGGRIASFLNSLFTNQIISSKKKKSSKSSTSTHSLKDEDESPTGRRKRRSSISHFPVVNTTKMSVDSKSSIYTSSSSSGFRTPPYSTNAPKNNSSYKDLRSCSDHEKPVLTNNLSKSYGHVKSAASTTSTSRTTYEKFKGFNNGLSSSDLHYIKFTNDDGADSDSSSDLFELPNYDLSGLPVYETTHMDNIKPITGGTNQVTQRV